MRHVHHPSRAACVHATHNGCEVKTVGSNKPAPFRQVLCGLTLRLSIVRTPASEAAAYVRAAADLVSRSSSSGGSTPGGATSSTTPLEPLFSLSPNTQSRKVRRVVSQTTIDS